jgi:hypothetical protein
MHVFHSYNVQTVYIHEYTGICMYDRVHTCLDHVYSIYIHGMYNFTLSPTRNTKRKILQRVGYKATIVCIASSCLNHYAASMLASDPIVTVHLYCLTGLGRLVTRSRTSSNACPPGRHDIACPSINMDLFKAEVLGEAGLDETAISPKQYLARARSQVDLKVREFRSSNFQVRLAGSCTHKP